MCGYIQINYTQYTQIYYVKPNFYFGLDAINRCPSLIEEQILE